jgi:Uma2 family endonuclease
MSTALHPALLTAEEFVKLPENGLRELVRGQIVELPMPGTRHGYVCMNVGRIISTFVRDNDRGRVMSNDTFVLTQRAPDTVRGSDICYFSYDRLPRGPLPVGIADNPPELVFEVKSPSDRWVKVIAKAAEYLDAGVLVVCIVDPEEETLTIYRPDKKPHSLMATDELSLPDILAGFSTPVRKFFE